MRFHQPEWPPQTWDSECKIIWSWSGSPDAEVISFGWVALERDLRRKLKRDPESKTAGKTTGKRVIKVLVEMGQNLIHHAKGNVRIAVGRTETAWWIGTHNIIDEATRDLLIARWEPLRSMSDEALRTALREALASTTRSAHGGGGVGLLEIMRRSGGTLLLNCLPCTEKSWHLVCTAQIDSEPLP
jgi:hypothetical protein